MSAGEQKQLELEGRIQQGEQKQALIVQNISAIQSSYLPLAGGSMTGDIAMNGKRVTGMGDPNADAQAANKRYVDTRLKKTGGTTEKMEGILYMGGFKIAGVGDPELSTDAANKRWVESKIEDIPSGGGGGPTSKYDSNFYTRSGVSGATLNQGDVMYMNDQLVSTTDPHEIAAIAYCPFDFDWDECAYSGVIRVRSGGTTAGYYQVYNYSLMENRMMILYVCPLKVEDGVSLGYESGSPCRFQGVFFE